MLKPYIKVLILIALISVFGMLSVSAQPNEGSLFEPVTDTPVNAGIMLMVAAGIGYGMKKLNSRKK